MLASALKNTCFVAEGEDSCGKPLPVVSLSQTPMRLRESILVL